MWEEDILPFVMTWMDLECIIQSEISQAERQGLCDIYLYVESKKAQVKKKENCLTGIPWWSGGQGSVLSLLWPRFNPWWGNWHPESHVVKKNISVKTQILYLS